MSNNLSPVSADTPLNVLKPGKSGNTPFNPDNSFQQLLQTEIGTKLPMPAERPATPAKPANTNAAPRHDNKPNTSKTTNTANTAPATTQTASTAPTNATPGNNGEFNASQASDIDATKNGANQTEQENTAPVSLDANSAAQLLAMTGMLLPGEQSNPSVKPLDDTAQTNSVTANAITASDAGLTQPASSEPIALTSATSSASDRALNGQDKSDMTTTAKQGIGADSNVTSESKPASSGVQDFSQELQSTISNQEPKLAESSKADTSPVEAKIAAPAPDANSTPVAEAASGLATTTQTSTQPSINKELSTTVAADKFSTQSKTHADDQASVATDDVKVRTEPLPPNPAPAIAPSQETAPALKASVPGSEAISAKVGTTAWDRAVGQKVVWMVGSAIQSAELSLNPPDLGPLQVVLSVSNDQASASFSAAQPEVREALESAMPRLKQMLNDAGVQLSGFSVSAESQPRQQYQAQQSSRDSTTSGFRGEQEGGNITTSTTVSRQEHQGLVDTFA